MKLPEGLGKALAQIIAAKLGAGERKTGPDTPMPESTLPALKRARDLTLAAKAKHAEYEAAMTLAQAAKDQLFADLHEAVPGLLERDFTIDHERKTYAVILEEDAVDPAKPRVQDAWVAEILKGGVGVISQDGQELTIIGDDKKPTIQ